MTSQVNPFNIDGTYPVAGQDNDSQGFRDNFTNTRNNFAFVKSELEDLQSKVLLKSALNNTTLNNDLSASGTTLNHAQLTAFSETFYNNGSLLGSQTIDYNQGNYQRITTGGSLSIGFNNWPATGVMGRLILWVSVTSTAYTLTLPAQSTLGFPSEIAGDVANVITFDATGDYLYEFISSDNGAGFFVLDLTRDANKVHGNLTVTGNVVISSQNLYIGPDATSRTLITPTIVAVDAGVNYAQVALFNNTNTGSADFAAYSSAGSDAGGWVDMGFTGNNFSDSNYTITKKNDGYVIVKPESNSFGGNLVLGTSNAGSYNDVVISSGSFFANAEVARFHGNTLNSGTFTVGVTTSVANLIVATGTAPATASSAGTKGQIAYDTGFIYVCTATNTWKRAALATW